MRAALLLSLLAPTVATAQVLPLVPEADIPSREETRAAIREWLAQKSDAPLPDSMLDLLAVQLQELAKPASSLSLIGSGAIYASAAKGGVDGNAAAGAIGLQLVNRASQWTILMRILATEDERRSGFGESLLSFDAAQGLLVEYQQVRSATISDAPRRTLGWTAQAALSSSRWRDSVAATSARVVSAAGTVRGTMDLFRGEMDGGLAYSVRFELGGSLRTLLTGTEDARALQRRLLGSGQQVFLVPDAGIVMRVGQTALQGRIEWVPPLGGHADIADVSGWRFSTGLLLQPGVMPLAVRFR